MCVLSCLVLSSLHTKHSPWPSDHVRPVQDWGRQLARWSGDKKLLIKVEAETLVWSLSAFPGVLPMMLLGSSGLGSAQCELWRHEAGACHLLFLLSLTCLQPGRSPGFGERDDGTGSRVKGREKGR